jgi:hypothetical protein
MDERFLKMIYDQWIQGIDDYAHCWEKFVVMAARNSSTTTELMLEELKKYRWFKWEEQ